MWWVALVCHFTHNHQIKVNIYCPCGIPPPGLVADCSLTDFIPSSCVPHTTDNDGLWTSIALAAEAFRYQVTGDEEAKENAWSLFLGMQFLNNVS